MKTFRKIMTYLTIVGLALIFALNYQLFIFPNSFAPAGLSGICTMIQYLFGINVGWLNLAINVPLALLAMKRIGKTLALRSLFYTVMFSAFLILFENVDFSRFAYETSTGTSRILGPLVAGIISGSAYSLLIRCGACGAGSDFISAMIHYSHPNLNFFMISFAQNVIIAGASYFVYGFHIEPVLLCIMYSFLSSTVSDHVRKKSRSAMRCEIITEQPEALSEALISRLHHSVTLIPAKGMYAGRETNVLICIVNRTQIALLSEIVSEFPQSFAVVSNVTEVLGNFKRLTPKGKREIDFFDKGDGKGV